MAIIVTIIGIICAIAFIPGIREDEEMKERRAIIDAKKRDSFFKTLVFALKQKNFMVFVFISLCNFISVILIQASISYWNAWILGYPKDYEIFPLLVFIITGVLGVPVWYRLGTKYGSVRMFIVSNLIFGFGLFAFLFISDLLFTLILFAIGGLALGGSKTLEIVVFSDVIDEAMIKSGKRQEGIYNGIRIFIICLSIIAQVVLFAIVHTATNYIPGKPGIVDQPSEALFGIRLLIGGIPAVVMLFGTFLFWKIYDITPEKSIALKKQLYQLNL